MKKALFVATVYKFLNFEKNDMKILKEMGYTIYSATNMREADWLRDDGSLDYLEIIKHHIDFGRFPFSLKSIIAYKHLKKLIEQEKFDLIHCHTSVAAAITRLAARKARKKGTKVIYTCHGFHFHKTSGMINWILYYPIEFLCSYLTDMIITINREDFNVIQKFPVKEKKYIPGVGIDVSSIIGKRINRNKIRQKYNIPNNAFLIITVGELSDRKNQKVLLKAIAKVSKTDIYCIICGTGKKKKNLSKMAMDLGIKDRVIFAGQVSYDEIIDLYKACDLGALVSKIEGLGLAGIECLAAGKPILASNVQGIKDYAIHNVTGQVASAQDISGFVKGINRLISNQELYDRCCSNSSKVAYRFDIYKVDKLMKENYRAIL